MTCLRHGGERVRAGSDGRLGQCAQIAGVQHTYRADEGVRREQEVTERRVMQHGQAARLLKIRSTRAHGPRRCVHRQHRVALRAGGVDGSAFTSEDQVRGVIFRDPRNGPGSISGIRPGVAGSLPLLIPDACLLTPAS